MNRQQLQFDISYAYPVVFTRDIFNLSNITLIDLLADIGRKIRFLAVIDSNVAENHPSLPERIESFAACHDKILEPVASPMVIPGGEICKNNHDEVFHIYDLINRHHLCRHSMVFVLGGGAVLDTCGYATATAHRGLRLLRFPTTTLSQNDAGVGVKNSLNYLGKKNFLGTFAPPFAVINDLDFLDTLQPRDRRAGIAEAVKVALLKDADFFDALYADRCLLRDFDSFSMERMITRCALLHTDHIQRSGDPFEQGSSRPLDFGHWSAHKIEELTAGEIRHGEAVAMGIALDATYSMMKGLITGEDLDRIISLFQTVGFAIFHPVLQTMDIRKALQEFQEHMGGTMTIPLIHPIGRLFETGEMDEKILRKSIDRLSRHHDTRSC